MTMPRWVCAFDLLKLNGEDLRRQRFEVRKAALTLLLRGAPAGVAVNAH